MTAASASFEIQAKSHDQGWKRTQDVLLVGMSLERFKKLRAIVRAWVLEERKAGTYNQGHGTMQAQAQHAWMRSGMTVEESRAVLDSVCMSETGLANGALCGIAMFSTVRVLVSRPPNTMEAAMAGEKTRWGRPMVGVAEELALGGGC